MTYCDYGFYTNDFRHGFTGSSLFGSFIEEAAFPYLSDMASLYVSNKTGGLSDQVKGDAMEAVKRSTCALAEIFQDEGRMTAQSYGGSLQVASESVGDWSRSYATGGVSGDKVEYLEKRKLDALKLYLGDLPEFASLFRATSYPCTHAARRYGY